MLWWLFKRSRGARKGWSRRFFSASTSDNRRFGFTLVELMIVLAIVMILTLIAVGSYGGVIRRARLNFAADTLVSLIKEQAILARSGEQTKSDVTKCFWLSIDTDSVSTAETDYIGVKDQKADFCEDVGVNKWRERELLSETFKLGINGNRNSVSELVLAFKPPFGKVFDSLNQALDEEYVITITYQDDSIEDQRTVIYSTATGDVYKE